MMVVGCRCLPLGLFKRASLKSFLYLLLLPLDNHPISQKRILAKMALSGEKTFSGDATHCR